MNFIQRTRKNVQSQVKVKGKVVPVL